MGGTWDQDEDNVWTEERWSDSILEEAWGSFTMRSFLTCAFPQVNYSDQVKENKMG
jgi:hypothetical protein